jgi:hypothetical protein
MYPHYGDNTFVHVARGVLMSANYESLTVPAGEFIETMLTGFVAVDLDAFRSRYRLFAGSLVGHEFDFIGYLNTAQTFVYMQFVTEKLKLPALAAVNNDLFEPIMRVDEDVRDRLKMGIGAFTAALMEANGYRKTQKKMAVPPVPARLFFKGELFER